MKRTLLRWLFGACLLLGALSSHAGCVVTGGGTSMAFGAYKPLTFMSELTSADATSDGSISIGCNAILAPLTCLLPLITTTYSVKLSAGGSNSVMARSMPGSAGGPRMQYNMYTNTGRTTVWGDGVTGSTINNSITGCGTKTHPFYGKVPAGQNTLKPGSFTEVLTITVSFFP